MVTKGLEGLGKRSRKQDVSDVARKTLKIAVLIPSYSGFWHAKFGESLANMVQHFQASDFEGEHKIRVFTQRGRVLPEIRHHLLGDAIGWEATHVLFLSTGLVFPEDSLHRMLARGRAVIGVNYLRNPSVGEFAAYRGNGTVVPDPSSPETEEVDGVALGMVLFNMPVFDVLDIPFFQYKQIGSTPGFKEDHVSFWEQCKEKAIPCVIDHVLSQDVKALNYGETWH